MRMMKRFALCLVLAAAILGHTNVFAQGKAGTTGYVVFRLAFPGSAARTTRALNLNDSANVVGEYRDAANHLNGFHYDHATGVYTALGVMATARGINQQDAIVGSDEFMGFGLYWSSPTAAPNVLPPLAGHTHSRAVAINNARIIVGESYIPEDNPVTPGFRAVVAWYINAAGAVEGPVELPFLIGDIAGQAWDLTETAGGVTVVVGASGDGASGTGEYPLPVSWTVTIVESGLAVTGPDQFGGTYSQGYARRVNNYGDAVGMVSFGGGPARPYLRRAGQSIASLPLLSTGVSGIAQSINDAGRIVGTQWVSKKGSVTVSSRAVLWTNSTTVVDLNSQVSLGKSEVLDYAFDINTRGDILARMNIGNTPCLLRAK